MQQCNDIFWKITFVLREGARLSDDIRDIWFQIRPRKPEYPSIYLSTRVWNSGGNWGFVFKVLAYRSYVKNVTIHFLHMHTIFNLTPSSILCLLILPGNAKKQDIRPHESARTAEWCPDGGFQWQSRPSQSVHLHRIRVSVVSSKRSGVFLVWVCFFALIECGMFQQRRVWCISFTSLACWFSECCNRMLVRDKHFFGLQAFSFRTIRQMFSWPKFGNETSDEKLMKSPSVSAATNRQGNRSRTLLSPAEPKILRWQFCPGLCSVHYVVF